MAFFDWLTGMNPLLFNYIARGADAPLDLRYYRDKKMQEALLSSQITFKMIKNDLSRPSLHQLTQLKNIFQKQLPKMPREYITRLVYDLKHESLVIESGGRVIGGITCRMFDCFCEIVFCAVSSSEQVKGFGGALMNHLKAMVSSASGGAIKHYLTYADNYAIGYFKKQGFTKQITLDRSIWGGRIKDYDGGTLMQCTVIEGIDYLKLSKMYQEQKVALVTEIDKAIDCARVYPGLLPADFPLKDPLKEIPGLKAAGWSSSSKLSPRTSSVERRGNLLEMLRPLMNELQSHPAAWPFLKPVDPLEVPSYPTLIKSPMDLSTIDKRLAKYEGLPAFIADFNLMINNCYTFNDPDTSYYKNAAKLEKFFQDRLKIRHTAHSH